MNMLDQYALASIMEHWLEMSLSSIVIFLGVVTAILTDQAYVPYPVVFPRGGLCLSVYIPPPFLPQVTFILTEDSPNDPPKIHVTTSHRIPTRENIDLWRISR
jgi:hypothetical protein